MKNIALSFFLFVLVLTSCSDKKKAKKTTLVKDTAKISKAREFKYKDILLITKDSNDTLQPKNLKQLFGVWIIDSIAHIGGTMETEELIQAQIGKQLTINNSILSLSFQNQNTKIINPHYNFVAYNAKNGDNLKATTLFYGYKDARQSVIFLTTVERDGYSLEIINDHELAYFYDGRIYFFKRKK